MKPRVDLAQYIVNDYLTALRLVFADRMEGKVIENELQYMEDMCKNNNLTLPKEMVDNLEQCITGP